MADIKPLQKDMETAPAIGSNIEMTISDLAVDGGSVARHGSLVFFLDQGLPGERVLANVDSLTPRFGRGTVTEILELSPDTAQPFCPHFGVCGGCAWQHLSYPAQLRWKSRHIKETLLRLGRVENTEILSDLTVTPSPLLSGYRNKVEYVFGADAEGSLTLGLRHRGARTVEPIIHCRLQSPLSAEILSKVGAWAKQYALGTWNGKSGHLRYLIIREPLHKIEVEGESIMQCIVELISGPNPPEAAQVRELARDLAALGVSSFVHSLRRNKLDLAVGEKILFTQGREDLWEKFGDLTLCAPVSGFLQTNTQAAALLADAVEEVFTLRHPQGVETLWDIYCGSGLFALHLAAKAQKVIGFEQDKNAVRAARRNARDLGKGNCRFWEGEAATRLREEKSLPEVVLVDPPRAGLQESIVAILKEKSPASIIYISCAPATLARDVERLAPEYRLEAVRAVDMFPHTPHVECVCLLSKP